MCDLLNDFKDEMALMINTKVHSSGESFRKLSAKVDGLTPALLSKINNYNLEGITFERLLRFKIALDSFLCEKPPSISLSIDYNNKTISLLETI
ncbi:TPA: hypothetical protein I7730_01490 [Vibrio vulnificus]|uniref:Uncharacterized protein n=1 Tax=Vibrio vulnificus TaxID=672 RepID=A0A8H9MZA6_VIBVL|nr:hypothetical protein [Vibrio vulnificus]